MIIATVDMLPPSISDERIEKSGRLHSARMFKTAFQQGRRRIKTGGVPSGVR
jgi:hypothetical protein